jgi:hypothetical protein
MNVLIHVCYLKYKDCNNPLNSAEPRIVEHFAPKPSFVWGQNLIMDGLAQMYCMYFLNVLFVISYASLDLMGFYCIRR